MPESPMGWWLSLPLVNVVPDVRSLLAVGASLKDRLPSGVDSLTDGLAEDERAVG